MLKRIFVYGTLKRGESRGFVFEHVLGHKKFKVTRGKTFGKLYDLGEFPGMCKGTGWVHGEVVEVSEDDYHKLLPVLDSIEGYTGNNNLYVRKEVGVETPNGRKVATTYFFNDYSILNNYGVYLESGTWRQTT